MKEVVAWNAHLYQLQQKKEADKAPGAWRAYYIVIQSGGDAQIIGRNPRRQSISVLNNGPGTLILSPRPFNLSSTITAINTANPNVVLPVLVLASGENASMTTSGGIYGACLTYSSQVAAAQFIETLFDTWTGPANSPERIKAIGQDGRAVMGTVEGAHTHDVASRILR
jgi:hypothetical protein